MCVCVCRGVVVRVVSGRLWGVSLSVNVRVVYSRVGSGRLWGVSL